VGKNHRGCQAERGIKDPVKLAEETEVTASLSSGDYQLHGMPGPQALRRTLCPLRR